MAQPFNGERFWKQTVMCPHDIQKLQLRNVRCIHGARPRNCHEAMIRLSVMTFRHIRVLK